MRVQIPNGKGQFKGEEAAHCKVQRLSAVNCAKTAETIEMRVDLKSGGFRKQELGGVHTGATWRIPLNGPCVAAMRPVVKLL